MPDWLLRIVRFGLITVGSFTVTSSVINVIGAIRLIEPADEAGLGVTRGEVIGWFVGPFFFGVSLIVLGCWRWKRRPQPPGA